MSKVAKTVLSLFLILFIFAVVVVIYIINVIINTPSLTLNLNALEDYNTELTLLDNLDTPMQNVNSLGNPSVNIYDLPPHTIPAFLSIEDHTFYEHNGLNYSRILRATINNIFSGYAKEGASTITQQLIKNTHLTNEKTFDRKIREAYLALQLEKQFTKDEILNTYLNILYFGNGIYGIESASQNFFGHSATNLTLPESATLAGIIKSPAYYSPINQPDNCIARRNLVLQQMLKLNKITTEEYNSAINTPLTINDYTTTSNYMYTQMVHLELMDILSLTEKEIMNKGLKIYTYFDPVAQTALNTGFDTISQYTQGLDKILLMLDNTSSSIVAFTGTKIDNTYRQCGSLIKPILCYGSALEKNILYPISQILDEKINYNGYSPQNVDKKEHGWVSMRYALTHSLNIPAVKTLDYVGLDYAKNFASKFGIQFTKNDNHLALSLGSMEKGTTIQQIADCYATFARNGTYIQSKFIKKIVDRDNNVIYSRDNILNTTACSHSTAFMINDILSDCTKNGTAKKLGSLNLNLASKTGTVGTNDDTNTDAWCISYNPKYTWASWCGNITGDKTKNLQKNQNGGTICCNGLYTTIKNLNNYNLNSQFNKPDNVKLHFVDKDNLINNHKVTLTNIDSGYSDYFVDNYLPLYSKPKLTKKLDISYNSNTNLISWQNEKDVTYIVYATNTNDNIIQLPFNTKDNLNTTYIDKKIKKVYVQAINKNVVTNSNTIELYTQPTKTNIFKKISKLWLNKS